MAEFFLHILHSTGRGYHFPLLSPYKLFLRRRSSTLLILFGSSAILPMTTKTVAIIGAGSAGLCTLRACQAEGLRPTVYDIRTEVGGLWSTQHSPVFDSLTTNTACYDTCISDLPPPRVIACVGLVPDEDGLCLKVDEVRKYFRTIADCAREKDANCFRLGVRVLAVRFLEDGGCEVESERVDNRENRIVEGFDFVVVATGYHNNAWVPPVEEYEGLQEFPGLKMHSAEYNNAEELKGMRVLVMGGLISGCEIAADIAHYSPGSIVISTRHMRHLVAKQKGDTVFVSDTNTRFYYLLSKAGRLWDELDLAEKRKVVKNYGGDGGMSLPSPEGDVMIVKKGQAGELNWCPTNKKIIDATRMGALKWNVGGVDRFYEDGRVRFKDGTEDRFDAVIFATGFRINLSILDEETRKLVVADESQGFFMDLAEHTLHPERPRLAFVGMYAPGSSSMPMHDMQARWVAQMISKEDSRPRTADLWQAIDEYRTERCGERAHFVTFGFQVLDRWARLAGCEVDLSVYKEWTKALLLGPLVPAQFRLFGEGQTAEALEEFERQMTAAGFEKGDNLVEGEVLQTLDETCRSLEERGDVPDGLRQAVDYLFEVNKRIEGGR